MRKRTHNGALCASLCVHLRPRAHKRGNLAKGKDRRESDERKVSRGCIQTYFSFVVNKGENPSVIVLSAKGGFILSRFTMLYGVGLAASTNNCQLNVRCIDRPRYQLRESNGYPSIMESGDFTPFFVDF